MVDGASTITLFPYLLNVMGSGGWCRAMTLFPYLLDVIGIGGWCQCYNIVSLPAECDG